MPLLGHLCVAKQRHLMNSQIGIQYAMPARHTPHWGAIDVRSAVILMQQ